MNLDPHYLKEVYRSKSTDLLQSILSSLQIFDISKKADIEMIQAELERRERETT